MNGYCIGSLDETVGAPRQNVQSDGDKRKGDDNWDIRIHHSSLMNYLLDGLKNSDIDSAVEHASSLVQPDWP